MCWVYQGFRSISVVGAAGLPTSRVSDLFSWSDCWWTLFGNRLIVGQLRTECGCALLIFPIETRGHAFEAGSADPNAIGTMSQPLSAFRLTGVVRMNQPYRHDSSVGLARTIPFLIPRAAFGALSNSTARATLGSWQSQNQ